MNKKISLGAAIAFMAVVASITFCVTMLFSQDVFNKMITNVGQREEMYDKVKAIDEKIRDNYLFEIDEETLLDSLGDGMIEGLDDQYARYLDKDEYEEKLKEDQGQLVGIGVQITYDETSGYLSIVNVYEGSPAEGVGLQKGDLIVKVDDQDLSTLSMEESTKLIQGEAGTKVKLVVRREGVDTDYEIQRKDIVIPSVSSRMIGENGYIKITDFNDATVDQFKEAVDSMTDQGAKGLIFDLRNNGGGTLDSVLDMLDYLLPKGTIATSTDSQGNTTVLQESDSHEINLPMVVLTNGNTASASELFTQALKDYNKAVSVGTTTYGKGVMQTTFPLSDGSAVIFTTAYFNPPSGENFNGVGIKPDYEVTLTADQEKDFENLNESNDPQLMKAIDVLNSQS